MADTVEAIIGAVYLDGGIKSVTGVMQNMSLVPRIVRRIKSKSPSASMSTVKDHEEPEMAPRDSEERLVPMMKSSQELENSVREHSIVVQLKQRPN